ITVILIMTVSGFSQTSGKVHVVRSGDTLWDISTYYLHNPFLWPSIYNANEANIKNPHWIYPGQMFSIPPILARKGRIYLKSTDKNVEVEAVAAAASMVAVQLAYKGGFLSKDNIETGFIVETEQKGKETITSPDTVYIDLGEVDGVHPGDLFTIFRWGKKVKDPETGAYLGKIVHILGKLLVMEVVENSSSAEIIQSFDIIKIHDMIKPFRPVEIPTFISLMKPNVSIEGRIAAAKIDDRTIIPFQIVYINLGKTDGIATGDYFEIFREGKKVADPGPKKKVKLPEVKVGALQVLRTTNESATCYITDIYANIDIEPGETIRLIGKGPGGGEAGEIELEEEFEEIETEEEFEEIEEEEEAEIIEPE
ncbi:MAG: LysM peptidoglycan-binding domain-containing protein, partial [Candidatus Cloacimonadota bacterium]